MTRPRSDSENGRYLQGARAATADLEVLKAIKDKFEHGELTKHEIGWLITKATIAVNDEKSALL